MTTEHRFRTGDVVRHRPTGEKWMLAYADYETGYLSACGWPDSEARISDCEIVKPASEQTYIDMLAELSVSGDRRGQKAARIAERETARAA